MRLLTLMKGSGSGGQSLHVGIACQDPHQWFGCLSAAGMGFLTGKRAIAPTLGQHLSDGPDKWCAVCMYEWLDDWLTSQSAEGRVGRQFSLNAECKAVAMDFCPGMIRLFV
ncbi:MAG: hypothetical protein AMXMBFR13_07470 [Phycisphaerae bacterium]